MNETEEKLNLEIVEIKDPGSVEMQEVPTTTQEAESAEITEDAVREPLFRVVVPKRRTWFYHFKYFLRGTRFIQAILGPQVKALPAPTQFKY